MATHRYWRVYITESTSSSGDNFIRLYEVEFRGSVGGADQCNGGTASASHNSSTAYKLFNNNEAGDYWLNGGPSEPCWFQYDLGAGNAVDVAELRILNGQYQAQAPKSFSLQWSDDGIAFTPIFSWSNITDWTGGVEKLFVITPQPAEPTKQLAIFPDLPGLSWGVGKFPRFNTVIHRAVSGREQRAALMAYPLWQFKLSFEFLRDTDAIKEYRDLAGFFLARRGSYEAFLYLDPTDSVCADVPFGSGDGVEKEFQITRSFNFSGSFAFAEPVQNIKTLSEIRINGNLTTAFSISDTGWVTFSTAPAAEAILTWSGEFYFRVRFEEDVAEFNQFLKDLWELKQISFIGAPGNKI